MKIAYITAGAGGTICGNCLRDNALAAAMLNMGEHVTLVPVYTPIRTDEHSVAAREVFMGGVNIYLKQSSGFFRALPNGLTRFLDSPALIKMLASFAAKTQPEQLGALTLATLQGADGPLASEVDRLVAFLRDLRPDVVHLTNSMLAGLAGPIHAAIKAPIVCSLQGEDVFLDSLPEPYRERCYATLKEKAKSVNLFTAPSRDHAQTLCGRVGKMVGNIVVIPPGVTVADFVPRKERGDGPFTVGYLARIAPDKGLGQLVDAMPENSRLRAAGWVSPEHREFVAAVERTAKEKLPDGLKCQRDISREEKASFLRLLDVLSVPTDYGASKGLYVLEAWASGVPVVQPRIGIFPELIDGTDAGILVPPGDTAALRAAFERLRDNPTEAQEMGARGRKIVTEKYTSAQMAANTVKIYKTLLR